MQQIPIEKVLDPDAYGVIRRWAGGLCWRVRAALARPELEAILRDPEGLLASGIPLLKDDHAACVGAAYGYVIKRTNRRKLLKLLVGIFRRSRGRQAFLRAMALERDSIPTARPVATADRLFLGFPVLTYLITEEIPSAVHLGKWRGDKRATIQSVSRLIAQLHEAGYRHGDLKETNILFDGGGGPHLIDLDAVRYFPMGLPAFLAAKDVARLWRIRQRTKRYSKTDAIRFLRIYAQARGFSDLRWWWRKITRVRQ